MTATKGIMMTCTNANSRIYAKCDHQPVGTENQNCISAKQHSPKDSAQHLGILLRGTTSPFRRGQTKQLAVKLSVWRRPLRTPTTHSQHPALATQTWPGHPMKLGKTRFPGAGPTAILLLFFKELGLKFDTSSSTPMKITHHPNHPHPLRLKTKKITHHPIMVLEWQPMDIHELHRNNHPTTIAMV